MIMGISVEDCRSCVSGGVVAGTNRSPSGVAGISACIPLRTRVGSLASGYGFVCVNYYAMKGARFNHDIPVEDSCR